MNDKTKDLALLIFIILTIIGLILSFSTYIKLNMYKKSFEKEMAFRLDMEEKVNKLRSEKVELTASLQDKNLDIQRKGQLIENLNSVVSGNETEIKRLQSELERLALLKDKLEENLKDELVKKPAGSN